MPVKRLWFYLLTLFILAACGGDDDNTSSSSNGGGTTTPPVAQTHTLVGKIIAASNTATDSDVNDVNALNNPNNDFNSAQPIPNPVILGGYVNRPGAGNTGSSRNTGDIDDYFLVSLKRGQIINLFVANDDLAVNDLDLGLLDSAGNILNASVGEGATESITVPSDGSYFIQVHAHLGASNYVLNIGQALQQTSLSNTPRLSDNIVVGDVLIEFKQNDAQTYQAQNALSSLGLSSQHVNTNRRSRYQFDVENTLSAQQFSRPNACLNTDFGATEIPNELKGKFTTLMLAKCLNRRDDIEAATANHIWSAQATPNDSFYRYQWNYQMLNLPQAWDTTVGSSSVIVAVIDTGVLLRHPDLQGKFAQGYDFISDTSISIDGDGIDSNPDDPGDQSVGGSSFHGTHVAGVIGALTNNNEGIAGTSWNTKIMPLRVLGRNGNGSDYSVEQAIRYAIGIDNDSGSVPGRTAHIINLSLGGPSISSRFQAVIQQARNAGVFIVAAAGNDNARTPYYPASLPGVISVSAVDMNRRKASYSNYNEFVDIAAPGGDNTPDLNGDGVPDGIISTIGDDSTGRIKFEYYSLVGTSMATPHVAGVISLMKAANPDLTPENVDDLISSGAITTDIGTEGRDSSFGYGLLDANRAVLAAAQFGRDDANVQADPVLVVTPQSLNFGSSTSTATLTLSNGGNGTLQILDITDDASGYVTVNGFGLGDYQVRVNRSGLESGTYSATIQIRSNINTINVPVIWQVNNDDPSTQVGDAGHHYILLIDTASQETIKQISASALDGIYDFRFTNVLTGTYQVVAGTDANNNNVICEPGEACGAYLTLSRPSNINIDNSYSGVDFSTGFNVNFSAQSVGGSTGKAQGYQLLPDDLKQVAH
ncbi:S8 family serine peptidase [Candidatus Albibeggiatoa sp. nov. NOAA]|uniref:S8 family peptidase n=1 Tax=Candidatus Albibeggiatoa sp. nov. NOAA TaxID=3162724 RepID=UPI0032FE1362|nr:S8 family serine peptidase [Thiotrichaceae bacterium]